MAPSDLGAARRLLRRHWGHRDFRPAQRPVLRPVLAGRDVLAVLPTGGGKSLCFQLPALLSEGTTLVVSPLVSLMEDQVAGCRRRGIPAACLTAAAPPAERRTVRAGVREGRLRLLYVAPERIGSRRFRRFLSGVPVARIAVDEAHCISEWGHDFRPAYRRIADLYAVCGRPPVVALTATATAATRRDVRESLALRDPVERVAGVDRPNLRWRVRRVSHPAEAHALAADAVRSAGGASIVYVPTRTRAVAVATRLRKLGLAARPYHAGLPPDARSAVQERFLGARPSVICATNAFGMGVDHPRVRLVLHVGIPGSLEAYVQEAGRAGRDGRPADCLLVSHPGERTLRRRFLRTGWPSPRLLARVWSAMPPGEARTAARVRRAVRGAAPLDRVEAALRLLASWGCVRPVHGAGGARWVRGPEALRRRIDFGAPRRARRRGMRRLRAMVRYRRHGGCRRAFIARYFDQAPPRCGDDGGCACPRDG